MRNFIIVPLTFLFTAIYLINVVNQTCKIHQENPLLTTGQQKALETNKLTITASLKIFVKTSNILDKPVKSKTTLIYIFVLLVNQSSNVETNPGPDASQYPCGHCSLEVTWSQKGIFCDSCDQWFHANCQSIGDETYDRLSDSRHVWVCTTCGLPNYATTLLESLNSLSDTNSFACLENDQAPDSPSVIMSQSQNTSIGSSILDKTPNSKTKKPNATSTPKTTKNTPKPSQIKAERISILNINCRSINNKIPDFQQVLSQTKPDVVVCTETWLKPDIATSEIFNDDSYMVVRDDRTSGKGGGVLLAISKRITCEEQPDLKTDCNIVWAKLNVKGTKSIYVSAFYKPHENDEHSLNELWESMKKIPSDSITWILGDFNMPDFDWPQNTIKENCKFKTMYENFMDNLTHFNLDQMVKIPTREKNTLDLLLTNQPNKVHATKTLPGLGTSDHEIVFHEINLQIGRPNQPKRNIKLYGKANWDQFKLDLNKYYNNTFQNQENNDPNHLWELFKITLTKLSSKHIPSKTTKPKSDLPWVTKEIIRLIRKRDKLYSKIKTQTSSNNHNSSECKSKLKTLRSVIQNSLRKSYWKYLDSVILAGDSGNNKNKKFYSFIKHKKTENSGISPLKSNGITHTDPVQKANILNKQFESVFSKPNSLNPHQISEINQIKQGSHPTCTSDPHNIAITVSGVEKMLTGLNPNKASGPDQISPRLLKTLSKEIAPFLTKIFRSSLDTGMVPSDWRSASVAPIFKKGAKCKPSNYRPISLTCIASKLMEHIIVSNLMNYFDNKNILSPFQHGFRSNHSCETQLTGFSQEIFDNLESGKQTDVIIMDFSKAFDKVDHQLLIYKLFKLGVNVKSTEWIRSFLSERTQNVIVEGHSSDTVPVMSGVPQGSVVGPSLFLAYINDLPDSLKSRVRLFADDTVVYLTINSKSDAETLQADLAKLETWENTWSMSFNPEKCEVIRISKKRNPIIHPYILHGIELNTTNSAKYLGLNISNDFSWKRHIEAVSNKANNTLKFIKRNVKTSNRNIKETAYKTYVRPQLEYCATIWHPWQKTLTYKIEKVQRAAARYVMNDYDYESSVTNMLQTLNWQTLEHRRIQSSLIMLYKITHHIVVVDHHHLTESRKLNFILPFSRTQYHQNSFFPRTIRYWNQLPFSVKDSANLGTFTDGLASVSF